ncbi:MAG TPA: hypothetical protein VKM55_08190 [Candidatus Lokiarchaeia archaeon]|nr:hypothetical protein [Candidatus Lokiarchaeia archaeon]
MKFNNRGISSNDHLKSGATSIFLGLAMLAMIVTMVMVPFTVASGNSNIKVFIHQSTPTIENLVPVIQSKYGNGSGYCNGKGISVNGTSIYTCGGEANNSGHSNAYLAKWDENGHQVWNRSWGGSDDDQGNSVWSNATDVYMCGWTFRPGADSDIFLARYDANGNLRWAKTWDSTGTHAYSDYGYGVWSDGTAVYTCGSSAVSGPGWIGVLIKWYVNGTIAWTRQWVTANPDTSFYSICGYGGKVFVCGQVQSPTSSDYHGIITCWNSAGTNVWNKTMAFSSNDECNSLWTDGSVLFVAGDEHISGNQDANLLKLDTNGNSLWNATWGVANQDDYGFGVFAENSGSSYVICTCGENDSNSSSNHASSYRISVWSENTMIRQGILTTTYHNTEPHAMTGNSTDIFTVGEAGDEDASPTYGYLVVWNAVSLGFPQQQFPPSPPPIDGFPLLVMVAAIAFATMFSARMFMRKIRV